MAKLLLACWTLAVFLANPCNAWISEQSPIAPVDSAQAKGYVVILEEIGKDEFSVDSVQENIRDTIFTMGGKVHRKFSIGSLNGLHADLDADHIEHLQSHPHVRLVEQDIVGHLQYPFGWGQDKTETSAPWGLGRISHREIETNGDLAIYKYPSNVGRGVNVYVLDSGVNTEHDEFQSFNLLWPEHRASLGRNVVAGEDDTDYLGHGTHVAGTIAGNSYGVAKKASIVAVKAADAKGNMVLSDVLTALEYILEDHVANTKDKTKNFKGSVINMSFSFEARKSVSLVLATEAIIAAGVNVVAAAGNDNGPACLLSPACVKAAITVGATNCYDERASFSNHGECVDIFAPGQSILSSAPWTNKSSAVGSGTSMASPHIAGLAAYLLSQAETEYESPEELKDYLLSIATRGAISDVSGSPNLLAYTGPIGTKKK